MSKSMPHVKWFGRDWIGDPLLRMVGLAERGAWIDLLCVMMQAEPYGHLAVNGKPMRDEDAARMLGIDLDTYRSIISRLEEVGIPSRTPEGMIYSRRLVRDHEAFMVASMSGKKGGGNPALRSKVKASRKSQKPEARSQKPEAREPLPNSAKVPIKAPIKVSFPPELIEQQGFEAAWEAFLDHRRHKKAYPTERAKELLLNKLRERPLYAIKALETAVMRGWTGFEWDWIIGDKDRPMRSSGTDLVNTWRDPNPDMKMRKAF